MTVKGRRHRTIHLFTLDMFETFCNKLGKIKKEAQSDTEDLSICTHSWEQMMDNISGA